jgi:5-methylcytosine-specific restriction endonuclease McrA
MAWQKAWEAEDRRLRRLIKKADAAADEIAAKRHRARRLWMTLRKTIQRLHGRHLWEADHIRPVVEGGGACGLENLRTLCVRCHKVETARLAARRAARATSSP